MEQGELMQRKTHETRRWTDAVENIRKNANPHFSAILLNNPYDFAMSRSHVRFESETLYKLDKLVELDDFTV